MRDAQRRRKSSERKDAETDNKHCPETEATHGERGKDVRRIQDWRHEEHDDMHCGCGNCSLCFSEEVKYLIYL